MRRVTRLPLGWHDPSSGTIRAYLKNLKHGIAPPTARYLYTPALSTASAVVRPGLIDEGKKLLTSFVTPRASPIVAVGMAFSQTLLAQECDLNIFAVNMGMLNLAPGSRQSTVRLFIDAEITPIFEEGQIDRVEYCFSIPGVGVVVRRWKSVMVKMPGQPAFRLDGTDAWITQHERDHPQGILCAHRALGTWRRLYAVPQEKHRVFSRLTPAQRRDWPEFPEAQFLAQVSGEFDVASYARRWHKWWL